MKKYFLKHLLLLFSLNLGLLPVTFAEPSSGNNATIDAGEMIRDIIAVVGLKANFDIRVANIPNAAAVTYNGKRYIAYNPAFISNLNAKAGNKWASVSILAHEVGHHLNGHTLLASGSQPALELEADEFSGFVLHKMGATLGQAQAAMKIAADYKPSLTHPGQQDRLYAIARGWNKASANTPDMAKYNKNSPVEPGLNSAMREGSVVPRDQPVSPDRRYPVTMPVPKPTLDTRIILARVTFPTDRHTAYFVTRQFNLVKLVNSQLVPVGKMLPTNSPIYPFVMKNEKGTLYVDKEGRIFTPHKELAGYLTMG